MRNCVAIFALLITAACATDNHLSQTIAHIPLPDITIIGRTDLTDVPTVSSGVEVHFEFRIVNQAAVPITLRRIELDSLGGGGITIEAKNRKFNTVIEPGATQSADFMTTAIIHNPGNYSSRSPLQLRATALFDSPEGSLQKVLAQQVRPEGSE